MDVIYLPKHAEVLAIGDVHEHKKQFDQAVEYVLKSPNRYLASVGDIFDKGFGEETANQIIDTMMDLSKRGRGWMIRGNHELKKIKRAKKTGLSPQLKWVAQQPVCRVLEFHSKIRLTMVHGGITPLHREKDLEGNVEVCYVRTVDDSGKMIRLKRKVVDGMITYHADRPGKSWHERYDGRFGYVVAGHAAQEDGEAKFYNYSCNLDSAVYHTGILTGQVFNELGKGDLIKFEGPARYPDLAELKRAKAKS